MNLLHTSLRNKNRENRTSLIFPPQFYQPTYTCIHTSPFLSIIINEVSFSCQSPISPPVLWIPSFLCSKQLQSFTPQSIPSLFHVMQLLLSTGQLLPTCKHALRISYPLKEESPCLHPLQSLPITLLCSASQQNTSRVIYHCHFHLPTPHCLLYPPTPNGISCPCTETVIQVISELSIAKTVVASASSAFLASLLINLSSLFKHPELLSWLVLLPPHWPCFPSLFC